MSAPARTRRAIACARRKCDITNIELGAKWWIIECFIDVVWQILWSRSCHSANAADKIAGIIILMVESSLKFCIANIVTLFLFPLYTLFRQNLSFQKTVKVYQWTSFPWEIQKELIRWTPASIARTCYSIWLLRLANCLLLYYYYYILALLLSYSFHRSKLLL